MRRGLKADITYTERPPESVAPRSPMRRGLKGEDGLRVAQELVGRTTFPDEEGTERVERPHAVALDAPDGRTTFPDEEGTERDFQTGEIARVTRVAPRSPMRRGLKGSSTCAEARRPPESHHVPR